MYTTDHIPGRTVRIEGQEWLYFSGTSYLGMNRNNNFLQLIREGLEIYGANFGGSRLSNPHIDIFERAEQYLMEWTGAEAALVVSSGTVAGQVVAKWLNLHSELIYAPSAHPALWVNDHSKEGGWQEWIERVLIELKERNLPVSILSNALDSLLVEPYDFGWLHELPDDQEITVVLDDSHGLGVTGRAGAGIYTKIQPPGNVRLVVVASMGKALGVPAGLILGPKDFISKLWQSSFFGGASPGSPAHLYAFLHAGDLYREAGEKLQQNVELFQKHIEGLNTFRNFDRYPVFLAGDNQLDAFLKQHRILISCFPYPTPEDRAISRIVLNSLHRKEDILKLAGVIKKRFA